MKKVKHVLPIFFKTVPVFVLNKRFNHALWTQTVKLVNCALVLFIVLDVFCLETGLYKESIIIKYFNKKCFHLVSLNKESMQRQLYK